MKPSESLRISGQPIAYFPQLAKPLGGVNASILFSHFFYWKDKCQSELGIYKTAEEIESETGLSIQEQRTARAKLRARGILIETEKRIEHRIYYKLDMRAFDDLMIQHSGNAESTAAKSNINIPEMQNQHSGNAESTAVYKNRRLQQKITTEDNTYVVNDENCVSDGLDADVSDSNHISDNQSFVASKATTPARRQNSLSEDKKRFEAIAHVYNEVFADCSGVAGVSLATVPNPKTGRQEYTKTNQKRLKLIPHAWAIAKMRIEEWADSDGLIDGEKPNAKHVLEWFKVYFGECRQDGFIIGTARSTHQTWKPNFDYLLKPETLEKRVLEK